MATKKLVADSHFTSQAEIELMTAIDTIISNLPSEDAHRLSIDFSFLRDYTVVRLQSHFIQLGVRNYTAQACACVGASRKYASYNNLKNLRIKKSKYLLHDVQKLGHF